MLHVAQAGSCGLRQTRAEAAGHLHIVDSTLVLWALLVFHIFYGSFHRGVIVVCKCFSMSYNILGGKWKELHSTSFCIYRENCPKTILIFENLKRDLVLIQPTSQLKEHGEN